MGKSGHRVSAGTGLKVFLSIVCFSLSIEGFSADGQSYKEFIEWIEKKPPEIEVSNQGTLLTIDDKDDILNALIPSPAWEYYIFADMEMTVVPKGFYPSPPSWGVVFRRVHWMKMEC